MQFMAHDSKLPKSQIFLIVKTFDKNHYNRIVKKSLHIIDLSTGTSHVWILRSKHTA